MPDSAVISLVFLLLALDALVTFLRVSKLKRENFCVYDQFTGERREPEELEANPLARFFWKKLGLAKGTLTALLAAALLVYLATEFVFPQTWFAFMLAGFQLSAIAIQARQLSASWRK